MMDLNNMVEAVRQLNQTWKLSSNGFETEQIPNDVYNAMCDVDEAITNLIEKVGEGVKVLTLNKIFKKF